MSSATRVKGHCPNCGPDRNADVIAKHDTRWDDDESGLWGRLSYRILQCPACETIYFQKEEIFSENLDERRNSLTGEWEQFIRPDITQWPAPSRRDRPEWADGLSLDDSVLNSLLREVYTALDGDLRVLAAIGIRTVFDRASDLLGVDPALPFAKKLSELVTLGKIGLGEKDILDTLTDAGSAAAHRGWKPKLQELDTMMSIIEAFVYRSFVLGDAARELKASVPAKQKKGKAAT